MSDCKGARLVPDFLLPAKTLIAARGHGGGALRRDLPAKGVELESQRKKSCPCDKIFCNKRNKIENYFAGLGGWCGITTRCDGYVRFCSTVCVAVAVAFWL